MLRCACPIIFESGFEPPCCKLDNYGISSIPCSVCNILTVEAIARLAVGVACGVGWRAVRGAGAAVAVGETSDARTGGPRRTGYVYFFATTHSTMVQLTTYYVLPLLQLYDLNAVYSVPCSMVRP